MAAATPLSTSAPGRIAPRSPRFPASSPTTPLACHETECQDPPIYNNVWRCDTTPFNCAQLQHTHHIYVSTKEKREMTESVYRDLLSDPDIQNSYKLREAVQNLYKAGVDWEVACKGVGDTLADVDPHMELVLAKLGIAAMYEHREQLTAFAPPQFACEIRKRKFERQQQWIPVCWYVLKEVQKSMVIEGAKQQVAEVERIAAERSARVRINKQEIRRRLSLEMKQILEAMERNMKNPQWLAQQLQTRYGADDLDADNLPPLAELQERYKREEEEEYEMIRKRTLAPVPGDEPDNIPLMFEMDSLE